MGGQAGRESSSAQPALTTPPFARQGRHDRSTSPPEADIHIDHQMSQPMGEGAHLTLTPTRPPTRADSVRAAAIADRLRRAITKYADVHVAEAEGFRRFAPRTKNQAVFHYTLRSAALRATVQFDPARPTSLLYRREPDGSLRLIGAMYTAPGRASLDELDHRVPLSIDAVGGRFLPRLFGWMVRAEVVESNDPATIWTAPHQHQHPS
jgi:hypothetical protein